MYQLCLGRVPSKTAHGVFELRHGVDCNVKKLANQRCTSMRNDFIRRVKDGKRAKVGTCVHRQLSSIFQQAREKDGENRIFDEVTPVATLRVLPIVKLDKTCTNADDRMILVRHRSGDRVTS